MDNDKRLKIGRKIILILGCISIIMGILFQTVAEQEFYMDTVEQWGLEAFLNSGMILIHQLFYVLSGTREDFIKILKISLVL